ncbi:autophagy-related protein 2 homolog B-like [Girardinichthys multiradiatus]|uniref:autophagy-related protein 2 homolog B-like n=1 Tax=Girardinichthys multiradiatus TaxID=208333 RepID=UPI001FAE6782|nr:autophagy-related protein 2 homolog B-like [Girardinichthys multiradiatus]XP_047201763.1 autophagy-related protein 2 homolog B-like [Girardinichthys multiradiatus]XP_047201764.1 autophagy-related protein 2 homolog B-like [Girardinichthys multiradiatus]XP_047201765.1 autophagy-related protein 2 homolog B-like [Girardinichthys multiradiatus]
MPWPFSESIKKRACRYLLHRYLGNFLQEKLSLDQLSLDLYQGTGSLAQVPLDKWSLNELLETADAPFEVIAGFIQTISLTVPWAALLQENCALEVKGLEMVLRPRPRVASGTEPMYWSSFMTSSMQLAKECLNQKLTDDMGENFQPFEGLEKFAETIETVLRRVKVTFLDTVLRVEHIPENSKTGIALEIRIRKIVYCDETGEESPSVNVHQPTTFAHKNMQMDGITVFWDEFSVVSRDCRSSPTPSETESKLSPSWNPKIICEPHPQFTEPLSSTTPFETVQVGSLSGKIELSLTLKNNLALPGAKLDVVGHIDTVLILLSPRQVHLLLDLFGAFSGGVAQEWNKDRKNRPIQQEDEYRLHLELNRCLKRDTVVPGADPELFDSQTTRTVSSRDDVFFSMADMDMSHSLSSLPPLGEPPTVDLDLSLNSNYSASPVESPSGIVTAMWDDYMDVPRQRERQAGESSAQSRDSQLPQKLLRQTSHSSKTHGDESRPELVLKLSLSSFAVSVLHIDPLPPPHAAPSPVGPVARHFFSAQGPSQLSPDAFLRSRSMFDKACPHDHLRFVGQGLKISNEHCQGSNLRTFRTDISLNQMEFVECLFPSDPPVGGNQRGIQYTELLKFETPASDDESLTTCLHLLYKLAERRGPQAGQVRLSTIPRKAEIRVELGPVRSELDISIVDRLNSLLQPQKLATTEMMASHLYTSYNKHISLHKAFAEVFLDDTHTPSNCHISLTVNAPVLGLAVRFPIPDLRSDQERGPWFKKSLQKEVLFLELEDLEIKTEFMGGSSPNQTKMELTFKELTGKFQEEPDQPAVRFIRVSHNMEGDMMTSESVKFDWPRVVLKMNPTKVHSILERVTAEDDEGAEDHSLEEEEEEGASHSLKDVCDFGKPEPSPFSSRRVMYENEEMIIPGDVGEMTEFQEKAMNNSRFILELCFPNVQLALPGKAFYEKLHNRVSNDLLLWEPTAPSPVETVENMPYGVGLSVASQLINTYSKDSFSQFRSTGPDEETSGSEDENLHYCSPASDLGFRSRKKKKPKVHSKTYQSLFSVILSVSHGLVALQINAKKEDKSILKNKHGEFWIEVKNAVLFSVTQYEGFKDQHYICFHTSSICMYHQGLLDGGTNVLDMKLPCRTHPHWLEPTIYQSETSSERSSTPSEGIGLEARSMVSVAVKISSQSAERNIKEFLVAVGVRGATLQQRVVPPNLGWYDQIVDFLNVSAEPVLGYAPPMSVTTLHLHLWSCSLDYRPLYLPLRSLVFVETFSISSSVSLDNSSSTLRIILDEAALFLSDKNNVISVNLARDYVQVVDMGTLELRIIAVKPGADGKLSEPRFELRCSSDVIHIRTCSDSCAALMNLIQYVASYGDLMPPEEPETKRSSSTQKNKMEVPSRPTSQIPLLAENEQQMLQDLMSEAMEETDGQQAPCPQQNGSHEEHIHDHDAPRSDLFLFPDESGNLSQDASPTYPVLPSPLITPAPNIAHETDDFCILETPDSRGEDQDQEPVVKHLTLDPVEIKDNHFSQPLEGNDSSRGTMNFPIPEVRYLIREISVIWHLYGGKDFGSATCIASPARSWGSTPHSSPSQTPVRQVKSLGRIGGGRGRNPDVLMEIQLSKVRFQHEVYSQTPVASRPAMDQPVSRQVFVVQDLEIRDRLATSQMNKFLYLYSSKEMPRKAHSNMLTVKALHTCPESDQAPPECSLRVSLMPLRLNIDQDALFFLKDFFSSLANEVEFFSPPAQETVCVTTKKATAPEISCSFSKQTAGSQDPAPIISVPAQRQISINSFSTSRREEVNDNEASSSPFSDQPIFFREFRFTCEVPIRLDYHGKHVSMDQGTFAGIIFGLTQLNCSELKLRQLCYRQGLLGVDKLFFYAINEWLNDIKTNQLQGILSGVAPINTLVKLVHGLMDLVWLPIEQYRKDGRIVRGFQRGTASFGTSTAMAALELTNRMVRTIQAAAETAYDMVSPVPDERDTKRVKRYSHYGLAHQPVDLREGVAKAYTVVKEGITDTALTIYDTATREHEQRGMTGAVGGVLRQLPPAVVKPLIMATEATSNVLGGMRNQIHPDARQEESQKWRHEEE